MKKVLATALAIATVVGVPTGVWACSSHGSASAQQMRQFLAGYTTRYAGRQNARNNEAIMEGTEGDLSALSGFTVDGGQFNPQDLDRERLLAEARARRQELEVERNNLYTIIRDAQRAYYDLRRAISYERSARGYASRANSYRQYADRYEAYVERYQNERTWWGQWFARVAQVYTGSRLAYYQRYYRNAVNRVNSRIASARRTADRYDAYADRYQRYSVDYARRAAQLREAAQPRIAAGNEARGELPRVQRELDQWRRRERDLASRRVDWNRRTYWVRITDPLGREVYLQTTYGTSFGRRVAAEHVLVAGGINVIEDFFRNTDESTDGTIDEEVNELDANDFHG